jgi:hypothetical protein
MCVRITLATDARSQRGRLVVSSTPASVNRTPFFSSTATTRSTVDVCPGAVFQMDVRRNADGRAAIGRAQISRWVVAASRMTL